MAAMGIFPVLRGALTKVLGAACDRWCTAGVQDSVSLSGSPARRRIERRRPTWQCASCNVVRGVALLALGLPSRTVVEASSESNEGCDQNLLLALHRRIEPSVRLVSDVHFNFTGARHYEVVEIISVFQVDRLCRGALRVIESIRLTFSILTCPSRYAPKHMAQHTEQALSVVATPGELPGALKLLENIDLFFGDLLYVAHIGSESVAPEQRVAWAGAESELKEVSYKLLLWVNKVLIEGNRLYAEVFAVMDQAMTRMLSTVVDFLRSIVEDISTLFRAPNFVAQEMMPEQEQSSPPTVAIFADAPGGLAFNPGFADMLHKPPAPLMQPTFYMYPECKALQSMPGVSSVVPLEFQDIPAPWAHRDVSGAQRRLPSPLQLLHAVAQHTRLSNLFVSLQLSPYLLNPGPKCGDILTLYDPAYCLLQEHWGGYFFQMNPLPPFNLTVVYAGKALGPGSWMPEEDVHSIHLETRDTQWSSLVSIFKSVNHHSPDLLYLSPFIGNCLLLDRLLATGSIKPKLLYVPINPMKQPPLDDTPNYLEWWTEHVEDFLHQLIVGVPEELGDAKVPITAAVWMAQCSLVATDRVMRRHGYVLLHVEHVYAVFVWGPLHVHVARSASTAGHDAGASAVTSQGSASAAQWMASSKDKGTASNHGDTLRLAWLAGWRCSPFARYLFDLEPMGGLADDHLAPETVATLHSLTDAALLLDADAPESAVSSLTREAARKYAAEVLQESPSLRYFLERGGKESRRGHCAEGICECFPPFRGPLCKYEDPPQVPQEIAAVIHYITADTERDMADIKRSLTSLWKHFNRLHDYPVVVFHDGLSAESRWRITQASENRVWLILLENFRSVPIEWASAAHQAARDFSVGYRAMIRWRSGPVFLEPALSSFDYAMTLDTDSYFPADVVEDPFALVHRNGLIAAFPHLGRESASVVVNFLHYFLLYCRLKRLHPRRTRMLASLIEKNFKWYQQCMMLDIEILRLDWFRGEKYQDMFQYMDSTGGFWLHRWGNNPFRTFAVGLLLDDKDVASLTMPYAHQDHCTCGPEAPACVWDTDMDAYRCNSSTLPTAHLAIGSLDEGLLDLQPWRGTARQMENFDAGQIRQFVEEHTPF